MAKTALVKIGSFLLYHEATWGRRSWWSDAANARAFEWLRQWNLCQLQHAPMKSGVAAGVVPG